MLCAVCLPVLHLFLLPSHSCGVELAVHLAGEAPFHLSQRFYGAV